MDEKTKKKKKLKQKQKQRQKQNQTVIVNVHSGKSTRSQGNPDKPRVQIPPPIHKVYASPIHDLTPQMFNKEGKQTSQPTLSEQLVKAFVESKQQQQPNVLEPIKQIPPAFTPRSRIPRIKISSESVDLSDFEMLSDFDKALIEQKKQRRGRKPGSKNKEKIIAEVVGDRPEVFGVAESVSDYDYNKKDWFPEEFDLERMFLRPSPEWEKTIKTPFNTFRPYDQPLNANTSNQNIKSGYDSDTTINYPDK